MIFIALVGRAVYMTQRATSDTAMFVYQGKVVADGGRMGVDLVDNKLPSVGLIMSVPYRIFGANWNGYTLLGLAMTIVASLVLYRSAKRTLGSEAAIAVGVASALWLNLPPMVFGQFQLETIQVFFISFAACATLEVLRSKDWRDALTIGLATGIAMWAKPTAGAMLAATWFAIFMAGDWNWRDRVRIYSITLVGLAIPIAVCFWILNITGMLSAMPDTLKQLRDYSANSYFNYWDILKPLFVIGVLMFPAVVLGYVFRRDRLDRSAVTGKGIYTFVIAWFVMELIGVIVQRRMYGYHFIVLGPPAAMILGLFMRKLRAISIGFALGPIATICMIWSLEILNWPDYSSRMTGVIDYLKVAARPNDKVWIDDYPRMMVESDLKPASRVPLTFLFGNSDEAPLHFGKMIMDDFQKTPPEWLVMFEDVEKYIKFYHNHMVEIAAYPKRGENFGKAWRDIDAYGKANYVVVQKIDKVSIMRQVDRQDVVKITE